MVKNMCFHHTEIGLRHLLATGFGMFVLVYTGRCAGVELPPIDADSLRAHLRFGLVQCDWQHSFTSTITDLLHAPVCIFVRATQGRPEYAFYQKSEDNFGLSS